MRRRKRGHLVVVCLVCRILRLGAGEAVDSSSAAPVAGAFEGEDSDAFDHIDNTQRRHQALPGRITPLHAGEATPKATPPRPRPITRKAHELLPAAPSPNGRVRDGIRVATVHPNGSIKARGCIFNVSYPLRGTDVFVIYEAAGIMVFDDHGTLIVEHLWPPPGIRYVGNGKPRGPKKIPEASPMP